MFISEIVLNPVDIIIGFLVLATSLIKFKSVISKDEILYNFTFFFSRKSSAFKLNGVLNKFILFFFATLKASWCHS